MSQYVNNLTASSTTWTGLLNTDLSSGTNISNADWSYKANMNYDWDLIQKQLSRAIKKKSQSFWEKAALQFNLEE